MMIHNLKHGQEVRIIGYKYTERTQGMGGSRMFDMVDSDRTFKIVESYRDSVFINGYHWDPRDVRPVKEEKMKPEIFHYDVSTLEGVE